MLRRTFFVGLALFGMAAAAQAGPMFVYIVVDPTTTAGAGVPGAGGFSVTSSKSGAGKFQVYAVDDIAGSNGIKSYQVKINGTLTSLLNRTTTGAWNDTDAAGPYAEAMNDVRTATAGTGITSGGQNPTNPFFVKGFGISAGNLVASNTAGAPNFDPTSTTAATSGQWGVYSAVNAAMPNNAGLTSGPTDPSKGASGAVRNAFLLAEGDYTGAAPTIDLQTAGGTSFNYFTSASGTSGAAAVAPQISAVNPFGVPEPATVTLLGLAFVGGLGLVRRRR